MIKESRFFSIRKGEGFPLVMAAMGTFTSIAAVVFGRTLCEAVLLSAKPAIHLPNFFIFSSLTLMGISLIFFQLLRLVSATKLNVFWLMFSGLGALVFQQVELASQEAIMAYAIFHITAPALGNIVVWNAIGDAFNARQGRRLFHLVSAASTLGGIASGCVIPLLMDWIGFSAIPIADGACYFLMAIPVLVLRKFRRSEKTQYSTSTEVKRSPAKDFFYAIRDIAGSPLLKNLSIIFFLTAVATNIIDAVLKFYLQTHMSKNEIAVFNGYFNAAYSTFNLIMQLTLLSQFLTRFKTRTLFAVTPIILLLFSLPFGFIYSFIFVVGLRFMDVALRFTIQDAAREIAISSLPRLLRNRAKVVFKGVMNPLGGIATGGLLHLFAPVLGAQFTPLLLVPISIITLYFVRDLNRYSAYNLYKQLQNCVPHDSVPLAAIPGDDAPKSDPESYDPELLLDDSPKIRNATLDAILLDTDLDLQKHSDVRRCTMALVAREARLEHAILVVMQNCTEVEDFPKNLMDALHETYEQSFHHLFKGMMAIYRRDMIQTIFQSLAAPKASIRAQAIELLQLTLNNSPYAKRILILCDDFDTEEKVIRLEEIEHMTVEDALSMMEAENDRHLQRIIPEIASLLQLPDVPEESTESFPAQ